MEGVWGVWDEVVLRVYFERGWCSAVKKTMGERGNREILHYLCSGIDFT